MYKDILDIDGVHVVASHHMGMCHVSGCTLARQILVFNLACMHEVKWQTRQGIYAYLNCVQ